MQIIRNAKGRPKWVVHNWTMISLEAVDSIAAETRRSGESHWPLLFHVGASEFELRFETEPECDRAYYTILDALGGSPAIEEPECAAEPYRSVYAGQAAGGES